MPNNILITPGSASIEFSGSAANTIRLQVEPSGSVAFYGNSGSLFGILDSFDGSLMSVNDISGLPILEVFSDDRVVMGTFNQNTLVVTGSNVGIGTATPNTKLHVVGQIVATDEITAYFSDARLKNFHGKISSAGEKVSKLNGYYFTENEVAKSLGYTNNKMQVGLSAQEVETVLPEAIAPAPFDHKYLTVKYEKLVPLLIEAIKEQQKQVEELQLEVAELKNQR
jgi:hypothetical protein